MNDEITAITLRVSALEDGHKALVSKVDQNTVITTSIKDDTADLVEFTKAIKGVVTVGKWTAAFIRWAAIIGGGAAGLWVTFKGWKF